MVNSSWLVSALLASSLNLMSYGPCVDDTRTHFTPEAVRYSTFKNGECHWNYAAAPDTYYDLMEWEPRGLVYYATVTPEVTTSYPDGVQYWPRELPLGGKKSGGGRSAMKQARGRRVTCSPKTSYVEYTWEAEDMGTHVTMNVTSRVVCNGVTRDWWEAWTWDENGPITSSGGWKDGPALWMLQRVD